ncbi:unnamed protein product [Toxocara canis]|uniref:TFIIS n=1 Tax=Toxocara canis TaxID=6265 RepID=A0A183UYU6_TOXCA|nr:unnamed protein product [Toxocara canis]
MSAVAVVVEQEWRDVIEKKPRWFHSTLKEGLPHGTGSAQSLSNDNDLRDSIPAGAHMQAPGPSKRSTNNEVRNKCVEMLLKALQSGVLPNGAISPKDVAVRIESKIFQVNGDTGSKYMSAVRSRVFNLRDKKNPTLLENVLTGVVEPERFALMTVEEMASDEMRRQRASFTEQAIKEHEMPMQEGTASDMFKCDNCHKKNCTYSQMQTRSADEPMTIFVFCRECGSRWKLH